MAQIKHITAREILDSRGFPTLETTVYLEGGYWGTASVPSGSSLGGYEAVELRDKDMERFKGMGVLKAIDIIQKTITPALIGQEASFQGKIDEILLSLDGTEKKEKLGANTLISVSTAVLKASAQSFNLPVYAYLWQKYKLIKQPLRLPTPCFNLINGGKHGIGNLDFQEYHLVPTSRFSFKQALEVGVEVYQALKKTLIFRNLVHSVGDDGGFTPNLFTNLDAVEIIREAIADTRYKFNIDVFLGLDVAANQFYQGGKYFIKDRAQAFSPEEFFNYYQDLTRQYHTLLLEDPFFEDDWESWQNITELLGKKTVIVGDDLLCTNLKRLQKAIKLKACNGVIIKPLQVGTITEMMAVVKAAKDASWQLIVSQRGSETNDDFIADLAMGIGAQFTKFGAPARGERVSKYNRLLAIEAEIQRRPPQL